MSMVRAARHGVSYPVPGCEGGTATEVELICSGDSGHAAVRDLHTGVPGAPRTVFLGVLTHLFPLLAV